MKKLIQYILLILSILSEKSMNIRPISLVCELFLKIHTVYKAHIRPEVVSELTVSGTPKPAAVVVFVIKEICKIIDACLLVKIDLDTAGIFGIGFHQLHINTVAFSYANSAVNGGYGI